jgi:hypothetical protein
MIDDGSGKKVDTRGGMVLEYTHAGFTSCNINHRLCHHTDGITCMPASPHATSTMDAVTALMASHACRLHPMQHQP